MVTDTDEFKSRRRLALASLGRNVLHFQRLESQLKILVLFCDFHSPLAQFAATHKKVADSIRMKTMGALVKELHERLYGKPCDPETSKTIAEASVSFQFRVDADLDYISQQKQQLSELVMERNQLIHQDLADFDPNSMESCQHWIARLDEQNARIMTQFKIVQELVATCREGFQKLLATASSPPGSQTKAPPRSGDNWKRVEE